MENESLWTAEEQTESLTKHFNGCLKFWEKFLNTDSDIDNEPYIKAIEEIPVQDPLRIKGDFFDKEVVYGFAQSRLMDCYGKEWQEHYDSWKLEYDSRYQIRQDQLNKSKGYSR